MVGEEASLDWVNSILQYSRKTKTVPHLKDKKLQGVLDLVSVHTVCRGILTSLLDFNGQVGGTTEENGEKRRAEVKYVHHVGDDEIPLLGGR